MRSGAGVRDRGGALAHILVCSVVSKEGPRRAGGVVAQDLEALLAEAAIGPDAEREGDADVAALVPATRTCDLRLQLLGGKDQVIGCQGKEE